MNDFSIDLETFGTRFDAPIINVGVMQFCRYTGKLGASYYAEIDIDSALKIGTPSGDAIVWWMKQNEKAKLIFSTERREKAVSLATALDGLSTWLRGKSVAPVVWGNGAIFDIGMLERAYDVGCVGCKEAWHFLNIRDMRTVVDAGYAMQENWPFGRDLVHHNALDDAAYQAQVISACLIKIRKALGEPIPENVNMKPQKAVKPPDEPAAATKTVTPPPVEDDDEL